MHLPEQGQEQMPMQAGMQMPGPGEGQGQLPMQVGMQMPVMQMPVPMQMPAVQMPMPMQMAPTRATTVVSAVPAARCSALPHLGVKRRKVEWQPQWRP